MTLKEVRGGFELPQAVRLGEVSAWPPTSDGCEEVLRDTLDCACNLFGLVGGAPGA